MVFLQNLKLFVAYAVCGEAKHNTQTVGMTSFFRYTESRASMMRQGGGCFMCYICHSSGTLSHCDVGRFVVMQSNSSELTRKYCIKLCEFIS
jgi:hypothetical protein